MFILLLTGPSATGKSTIAKRFIEIDSRWQLVNERDLLHELALDAGELRVRHWWQKAGTERLVREARDKTFVLLEQILSAGKNVIFDGCYDSLLRGGIEKRFENSTCLTVSVTASVAKRESYMQQRLGSSLEEATIEMQLIDQFKEEAGMATVLTRIDAMIDNNGCISESVGSLMEFLASRGCKVGQQ